MENGYSTQMTFIKTEKGGTQLVFKAGNGQLYRMSTNHFRNNISPKNKAIYTKVGGLPIEGHSYTVYLYPDTGRISLDRKVYLWEKSKKSTLTHEKWIRNPRSHKGRAPENVTADFVSALYCLGREIWDGLKKK